MTREDKMEKIDEALKRWLTRGMRAQNAINKLVKQKRRLEKPVPIKPKDYKEIDTKAKIIEAKAELVQAIDDQLATIASPPAEDLSVPPFLQRSQADVDKMKAERLAKVDKMKMPLTGRAALEAVRPKKKAKV